MFNFVKFLLIQHLIYQVMCNLEGPFVFWGPKELLNFKKPALTSFEQDNLLYIYNSQAAIVVFNIQDSYFFLSRENYPRLRKLLEQKPVLFVPQDFLDVHPEYVNNETQVITVQGPNSEQDAEITEKFERLEDVYGEGKVLAILGSSSPEEPIDDELEIDNYGSDNTNSRKRREISDPPSNISKEIILNAEGRALLYTNEPPILRYTYENSTEEVKLYVLNRATADDRGQFSKLSSSFNSSIGKVLLRFRFLEKSGYWSIGPIEFVDPRGKEFLLYPMSSSEFMGAPKGFSYTCGQPLTFYNNSTSLTFQQIQVQPFLAGSTKFGSAYDCVGFTTLPIWSGILVSFILVFGLTVAIIMITNIKTMDRFENTKGKTLYFVVSE